MTRRINVSPTSEPIAAPPTSSREDSRDSVLTGCELAPVTASAGDGNRWRRYQALQVTEALCRDWRLDRGVADSTRSAFETASIDTASIGKAVRHCECRWCRGGLAWANLTRPVCQQESCSIAKARYRAKVVTRPMSRFVPAEHKRLWNDPA